MVSPEKSLCRLLWVVGVRTQKGPQHTQSCSPAGLCTFRGPFLARCTSFIWAEKGPVYRMSLRNKRASHPAPEWSSSRSDPQPSPRQGGKFQKGAHGGFRTVHSQAPHHLLVFEPATVSGFPSHSQHISKLFIILQETYSASQLARILSECVAES